MDRPRTRRVPRWLGPASLVAVALVLGSVAFALVDASGRTLRVERSRVSVAAVTRGRFEDYIPIRGRIEPAHTIFLDAVEGGRVEAVHVEDGAMVETGQLLVKLSNTSLQLEVLAREAEVVEQLNSVRTQELQLERNRLDHKRNLIEIEYNLKRLGRSIKRQSQLQSHIARAEIERTHDEFEYWTMRKRVTLEAQATDEKLQRAQAAQLRAAADRLQQNLAVAQRNLDDLDVKAPMPGQLTALAVKVGQSLVRGERIGQIDDPDDVKLVALVDEFYLPRVALGQRATAAVGDRAYTLASQKIYPQVRNGQFEVDLTFESDPPPDVRRGQSLQAKLSLGDPSDSLLIPNGAFYQDTGGNWIFVVAPERGYAVRRNVRLGRRNARFIEVVDGLDEGEQVVTSPYTHFLDSDRLELDTGTGRTTPE